MSHTIYTWTVSHPEHSVVTVTAESRYHAVLAAAQEWGIRGRLGLHAECSAERGEAVIPLSPELDEEDERDG